MTADVVGPLAWLLVGAVVADAVAFVVLVVFMLHEFISKREGASE